MIRKRSLFILLLILSFVSSAIAGDKIFDEGIRIGTSDETKDGTVRYNGSNFQGYKSGWTNLDDTVAGGGAPSDSLYLTLGYDADLSGERLFTPGTGLSATDAGANSTYTLDVTLSPFSTTNLSEGSNLYFTDERTDDRVSSLIQNGTGLTWTYVDASNTLTGNVALVAGEGIDVSGVTISGEDASDTNKGIATFDSYWFKVTTGDVSASDDVALSYDTLDGMAFDKPDMTIVDDVGLKLDIEKVGGGDMKFLVDGVISTLDCTTGSGAGGKARVSLTAGSDANTPATNYIYITGSGGTATLSASTSLPTGAFAWIGKIIVPDATTWTSTGAYGFQRYTEAFQNDTRGLLSHEREKLRAFGAVYISGVSQSLAITTNVGTPDNVHLVTGSGSVYQLHRQAFPAFSTGPYYYGNGSNIYEEISDLNELLTDADGGSMSGKKFNLVVWGAVNVSSGECKLFVNLPNDSYVRNSQAISDVDNTSDYTVPDDMRSVAFMISRIALAHTTTSGGTWVELGTYSLLGSPYGARSGGAGAVASNEFDDSQFRIYDDADNTKLIAFQASGITTATTRTLTAQDSDGTIAYLTDIPTDISGEPFYTVSLSGNLSNETILSAGEGIDLATGAISGEDASSSNKGILSISDTGNFTITTGDMVANLANGSTYSNFGVVGDDTFDELFAAIDTAWPSATSPAGNDGNVQYNNGGVFGGEDEFFWNDTNKSLSLGTSSNPTSSVRLLVQEDDGTNAAIRVTTYSSSEEAYGGLQLSHARGTPTIPSAVLDQDHLGILGFLGHNGTGMLPGPQIVGAATEDWSVGNQGSGILLKTMINNSTTANAAQWIDHDGNVHIGNNIDRTTNPIIRLEVSEDAAQARQLIIAYADTATYQSGVLALARGRGTRASPEAIDLDDSLGYLLFQGHDGSAIGPGAFFYAAATENWSGSGHGAKLILRMVANTSTTPADAIIIENDGAAQLLGQDANAVSYSVAGSGLCRELAVDENGNLIVGSSDVACP